MDVDRPSPELNNFPNEVLAKIFSFLPPNILMRFRFVCCRWNSIIIRHVLNDEELWKKNCRRDFSEISESALRNSIPPLKSYQLYRTLTLWRKLAQTEEIRIQFSVATNNVSINETFQACRGGNVGVLKRTAIIYYNVDTIQKYDKFPLTEKCIQYTETDNKIFLLDVNKRLCVVEKGETNEIEPSLFYVSFFIVLRNDIYIISTLNMISRCHFIDGKLTALNSVPLPQTMIALGYVNDTLHILTRNCNIYAIIDNALVPLPEIGSYGEVFESLRRYNFTNDVNWGNFFATLKHRYNELENLPFMENLTILHFYGPVLFAGYSNGILRIFYTLYATPVIDLLRSEPLKVCNILDSSNKETWCRILKIDVVEGKNSHTILVATPQKMVAFKFTHPCHNEDIVVTPDESSASGELSMSTQESPLSEVQPMSAQDSPAGSGYEMNLDQPTSSIEQTRYMGPSVSSRKETLSSESSSLRSYIVGDSSSGIITPPSGDGDPSNGNQEQQNDNEKPKNGNEEPPNGNKEAQNDNKEPQNDNKEPQDDNKEPQDDNQKPSTSSRRGSLSRINIGEPSPKLSKKSD